MDAIFLYICENAFYAQWIIFGLILLAGLNVPVSLDLLFMTGGAITGTCLDQPIWSVYLLLFIASCFAAWESYWIGRLLGPKLYKIRWLRHFLSPEKTERLHHYYEKFGVFTFIVGCCIPGGVRNALFMTSGLGKMPFLTFIWRHAVGVFFPSIILFAIGHYFGSNHEKIIHFVQTYDTIIIGLIVLAALSFMGVKWIKKQKQQNIP